jgi:hypothetical protein
LPKISKKVQSGEKLLIFACKKYLKFKKNAYK